MHVAVCIIEGGFYIRCHSADEEGVPVPSKLLMAQGQNNWQLAPCVLKGTLRPLPMEPRVPHATSFLARAPSS
jgi:hypothetical protein